MGLEPTMKRSDGGRVRQRKEDGEEREREAEFSLGFHSYFFPSKFWISPKCLSWATVWIRFYSHLSSPTIPVLTCLYFIFQVGNKRQTARVLSEEQSCRKCRRSLLDELSRCRKSHTQKVINCRQLDVSIFCHLTGVQWQCLISYPYTFLLPSQLEQTFLTPLQVGNDWRY